MQQNDSDGVSCCQARECWGAGGGGGVSFHLAAASCRLDGCGDSDWMLRLVPVLLIHAAMDFPSTYWP